MKQLATHVYCQDECTAPPDFIGSVNSYVTTSEGLVLIDAPFMPRKAIEWRDYLAKIDTIRYIIHTDQHIDHIAGNAVLEGTVVSHQRVREMFVIDSPVPTDPEEAGGILKPEKRTMGDYRIDVEIYDPESLPLLDGFKPRPPTITFSERMDLYVGEHTFTLLYMPGHTQSHIGVYMPKEKIFFTGDNFTYNTQPSLAHSSPVDWVISLKKIEAMDIDSIVPGHGCVCTKKELREFREYIEYCVNLVKEAIKQGMSKKEAVARLTFDGVYPKDQTIQALHPEPEWQRRNVMRVYDMLTKKK